MQKEERRNKLLLELKQSEERYINYLSMLCNDYMEEMRSILPSEKIKLIFSNVVEIFKINQKFFQDIKLQQSLDGLINTLVLFSPYFKSYTPYVYQFDQAMQSLNEVRKKKKIQELLRKNKLKSGLGIDSLLIMPIQRIPRYVIVLREILESTSRDHLDYEKISECYKLLQTIADHVNETKRAMENVKNYDRLYEFSNAKLLLKPHRHFLLLSENVTIRSSQEKTFGVFDATLFNDLIIFMNSKIKFLGSIYLAFAQYTPDGKKSVKIHSGVHEFIFLFPTADFAREWIELLSKQIRQTQQHLEKKMILDAHELPQKRISIIKKIHDTKKSIQQLENDINVKGRTLAALLSTLSQSPSKNLIQQPVSEIIQCEDSFAENIIIEKQKLIHEIDLMTQKLKETENYHETIKNQLSEIQLQLFEAIGDDRFYEAFPLPSKSRKQRSSFLKRSQKNTMAQRFQELLTGDIRSDDDEVINSYINIIHDHLPEKIEKNEKRYSRVVIEDLRLSGNTATNVQKRLSNL